LVTSSHTRADAHRARHKGAHHGTSRQPIRAVHHADETRALAVTSAATRYSLFDAFHGAYADDDALAR